MKMQNLFPVAFNHVPAVDLESLVVKRKGKVIKGETEQRQAKAMEDRRKMKNALRRARQQRGYTLSELVVAVMAVGTVALVLSIIGHFVVKFW